MAFDRKKYLLTVHFPSLYRTVVASAALSIAVLFVSCLFNPIPPVNYIPLTPNVLSAKDSLAVRAILDANGLDTVKVRDVIDLSGSNITLINLIRRSLSRFVFTRYFDSLQSNPVIDLDHNNIDTVIFTDTILKNLNIYLENNLIRSISDGISKMQGPIALHLNYNQLTTLSPNILCCNLSYLYIRYNHLVSVPDSIAALFTSKDSTWMNYQTP